MASDCAANLACNLNIDGTLLEPTGRDTSSTFPSPIFISYFFNDARILRPENDRVREIRVPFSTEEMEIQCLVTNVAWES